MLRATAELIEARTAADAYIEGVRSALEQPEFATSVDRMLEAVSTLQAYRVRRVLEQAIDAQIGSTQVVIGREHGDDTMQDWSVVLSRYGDDDAVGTVAVIGPTRMPYHRTIPRVRYVARLMSHLLHEVRQS